MPEMIAVVPSRGRPHTVPQLAAAFRATCSADTWLHVAFDDGDPRAEEYNAHNFSVGEQWTPEALDGSLVCVCGNWSSMVEALNDTALDAADIDPESRPKAIAFMGDDHRPRTVGWDRAYLDTLATNPGIVYGNDQLQGIKLPTQCAISTEVIRAWRHMAPDVLTHLYLDNYWLAVGRGAGRITYLPDIVVEHLHPLAGKAKWDEGYRRVNASGMYERDRLAFVDYWEQFGRRDIQAMIEATNLAIRP